MNSRTWVAVILCCLVWFVYMRWYAPVPPTELNQQNPTAQTSATEAGKPVAPTAQSAGASAPVNAGAVSNTLLPIGFIPGEDIKKTTKDLEISFSKAGGKISRLHTLTHRSSMELGAPAMPILTPEDSPWELATTFTENELKKLDAQPYTVQEKGNSIVFTQTVPGAISIYKEYTVSDGHYIPWKLVIKNLSSARKDWGYLYIPLGQVNPEFLGDVPVKAWEAVSYQDDTVTRHTVDKLGAVEWKQGKTGWLGFGNRYFSTAVLPSGAINPDIGFVKDSSWTGGVLRFPLVFGNQSELSFDFKVFAGPKDYDVLRTEELGGLIDYGFFSFFAFPLLELLRFFYRFVHNYGLAIILLTLLVRILFYPLSLKGYRSMKAMQKLQPQIAALKEKYKDDTQRFGQEQMALFKTHKVNPAGGCLPMLVQLPVFIALYAVLNSSVELFHAPFYFWIKDLSAKDPFYVFPVLMGISMFVQQKMTPTPGMDPTQQKIMLLMPIIFSFIMLNLPSGLTIYIFLSTLLGILQQVSMNRDSDKASGVPVVTTAPSGK